MLAFRASSFSRLTSHTIQLILRRGAQLTPILVELRWSEVEMEKIFALLDPPYSARFSPPKEVARQGWNLLTLLGLVYVHIQPPPLQVELYQLSSLMARFNLRALSYVSQEHKYVQKPRPKTNSSGLNSYFGAQEPYQTD